VINAPDFQPPWLLRHPQLQSVLATKSPRKRQWRRRGSRMEAVAVHHELDAGDCVRLTGYLSQQSSIERDARGLVVLIHGWEGSHDSTYLYSMACALFDAGYSVFRLNLRDHGGTHHLNREVFHSARIDEVLGAIRAVQTLDSSSPLFVIGFSLGGNFALRVGLYGPAAGISPRLTVGICPSINPLSTIDAIDHGSRLFRWYFMGKWRKTVQAKVAAWPEYAAAAENYLRMETLLDITARFAEEQTEYGAMQPYLDAYTLTPDLLLQAPSPLAIITAADDPVIPLADFSGLRAERALQHFEVTRHGGHCGFIENIGLQSWAESRVLDLFARVQ
jgi:predicted alpha/beta-fold hydrolase